MGTVTALRPDTAPPTHALAVTSDTHTQWERLAPNKREIAQARGALVQAVLAQVDALGLSRSAAVGDLQRAIKAGRAEARLMRLAAQASAGKVPSRSRLMAWLKDYCDAGRGEAGLLALAPQHKGSARTEYGWEARALELYDQGSNPGFGAVADWLAQEGHETATYDRVRAYLRSLPSDQREGRGRLGPRQFTATRKPYVQRNTEMLPVGCVYQGDGHTLDVYLQHPTGNRPWRPELTAWIDIRSRYIPGWWISEAESAHSTLFALSAALTGQDHIPAILHIDNGSGYVAKMMSETSLGFYDRLGISVMNSLPYNAKGKGQIERWFRTLETRLNPRFASFCGHAASNELLQDLLRRVQRGEASLPTLAQYAEELAAWIDRYNHTPHRALDGRTPAEVWAGLEQTPVVPRTAAIFWPRVARTVQRTAISLDGRQYRHPELMHYHGASVTVEYSIHDDAFVRVLDAKDRWVCDATLTAKADYLPSSRIEQAKTKRLAAQVARLERHAEEKRRRADLAITADQALGDLVALTGESTALVDDEAGDADLLDLNSTGPGLFGLDPVSTQQPEAEFGDQDLGLFDDD